MCTAGSSFVATIRTSPPAVGLAESQLSGGDFLCDIDYRRTDDAGSSLRAVLRPLASTTLAYLVRRFGDKQLAGVENAVGFLVRRSVQVLAEKARAGRCWATGHLITTTTQSARMESIAWTPTSSPTRKLSRPQTTLTCRTFGLDRNERRRTMWPWRWCRPCSR